MRSRSLIVVAVPIAIAAAACGRHSQVSAKNADLQRDLRLASTTTMTLTTPQVDPANFDALETAPESAPLEAARLVRARGPKAMASKAPDLRASFIPQLAAPQAIPQAQTVAAAPAPVSNQDPVATMPHAGPAPRVPGPGTGAGVFGGAEPGSGPGIFGPGVVIRGGGIGGDNCSPHGGRGRIPGVYMPIPGGAGGGSIFPVMRPGGSIRP